MYKLILVDDEEEVRKGMLKKIKWEEHGFLVVGEAENGREALEIAEKVQPDVVVTDIKMPFMDGIVLSEELRKEYPSISILILTGFDEFAYAQKAIKLNVFEYVLKPVSSIEFIEVLSKLKGYLDEEKAKRMDLIQLREHYQKSLPVIQEKLLTTLLTKRVDNKKVFEIGRNVQLQGELFNVSVICIEKSASSCEESEFNLPEDWELLKYAVYNIVEETMNKHQLGKIIMNNDSIAIISCYNTENLGEFKNRIHTYLEEVIHFVYKYLKQPLSIGLGRVCEALSEIHKSYIEALNALDYRAILGKNKIIDINDVEPIYNERLELDQQIEHLIYKTIKVGTIKEMEELIDSLFVCIIKMKISTQDYQIYLVQILTTILKVAKDFQIEVEDITAKNPFAQLYGFKELYEIKEWLMNICTIIIESISVKRNDTCKSLIYEATEYVKNNYTNSELTIEQVCKHIHLTPNYFSTIFKKEMKISFVNYLTNVRMEIAKQMLKTTNLKVAEIAEKVGYSEPNYFSYCFKKAMSKSPSEFRSEIN